MKLWSVGEKMPAGGVTTVLHDLIVVLGARIWVENKVDFHLNEDFMPAAIARIIGASNYTWVVNKDITFEGIALKTVAAVMSYHVMHLLDNRWRSELLESVLFCALTI